MARLNLCASLGLFMALAAAILMIFAEISQISSRQVVPRSIRMATVDTSGFGQALQASGSTANNLYGNGGSLGNGQGLKQYYSYGLWAYCGSDSKSGTGNNVACSGTHWGNRFQPASAIVSDVPQGLQTTVTNALPGTTFSSNSYLGKITQAAFYLYFIGAIAIGVSLILGLLAHRFAFLFSALFGIVSFMALAAAAIIWTIVISRVRSGINNATLGGQNLGIRVSYGNGLWITWAAAGAALISILPFFLACCFGRRSSPDDYEDEKYYQPSQSQRASTIVDDRQSMVVR